jgi:hypothetical protein
LLFGVAAVDATTFVIALATTLVASPAGTPCQPRDRPAAHTGRLEGR